MKLTKEYKIFLIFAVCIMAFCTVFFTVQSVVNVAYADDGVAFDKTSVLEDLQSSTINGQAFDLNEYPADENGSVKIINFVEYCYSATKNMHENYGLYIYVYNPQKINFSTTSQQNKIQIAVAYDEDGKAIRYEKFHLVFCDKSDGDYIRVRRIIHNASVKKFRLVEALIIPGCGLAYDIAPRLIRLYENAAFTAGSSGASCYLSDQLVCAF